MAECFKYIIIIIIIIIITIIIIIIQHPSILGDDEVVPGWVSGICRGGCVARPVNGSLSGTSHIWKLMVVVVGTPSSFVSLSFLRGFCFWCLSPHALPFLQPSTTMSGPQRASPRRERLSGTLLGPSCTRLCRGGGVTQSAVYPLPADCTGGPLECVQDPSCGHDRASASVSLTGYSSCLSCPLATALPHLWPCPASGYGGCDAGILGKSCWVSSPASRRESRPHCCRGVCWGRRPGRRAAWSSPWGSGCSIPSDEVLTWLPWPWRSCCWSQPPGWASLRW